MYPSSKNKINPIMNMPSNIMLNTAELKVAQQMIMEKSTESSIKRGLEKYVSILKEVQKKQTIFNLTDEQQQTNNKEMKQLGNKVSESEYKKKEKMISLSHQSKSRKKKNLNSNNTQNMTTIFRNIKLEEDKGQKICESRFIISKREVNEKKGLKRKSQRSKSIYSSLSKEKNIEGGSSRVHEKRYIKGEILRDTLKKTKIFIDMLKLMKE